MLIYLIDGNNLYHAIPEIADLAEPRIALISYIRKLRLCGSVKNRVILVFDGFESPDIVQEREYEVLFGKNKSADEVIKQEISKKRHKRQLMVVSDDHSILDYAKMEGAQILRIKDFLKKPANTKTEPKEQFLSQQTITQITKELEDIWVNKKQIHFEQIDSTHLYAIQNGSKLADQTVITADYQSQGQGRQDRVWVSKPGDSLLLSLILKPQITPFQASLITPVLSLALVKFLEALDLKPQIKWPNDILIKEKKIAGILAQAVLQQNKLDFVVASFGLNINQDQQALEQIDRPATSIFNEVGQKYQPNQFIESILEIFHDLYAKFLNKGFDVLFTSWQKKMVLKGEEVLIDLGKHAMQGRVYGFKKDGSIQIKDHKGEIHNFNSGEIKKIERQSC
ncbi:MAG: biotin--[acetyl-CoA-carboxylase] ligase [Pseudomonadota bacterium]